MAACANECGTKSNMSMRVVVEAGDKVGILRRPIALCRLSYTGVSYTPERDSNPGTRPSAAATEP